MAKKCIVCKKPLPKKFISKSRKDFCCKDCLQHYQDVAKPNTKDKVCEFC